MKLHPICCWHSRKAALSLQLRSYPKIAAQLEFYTPPISRVGLVLKTKMVMKYLNS